MRLSSEAITAARERANSMGFAINDIMAASILEAGIEVLAGQPVTPDDPMIRLGRVEQSIQNLYASNREIVDALNGLRSKGLAVEWHGMGEKPKSDLNPEGV